MKKVQPETLENSNLKPKQKEMIRKFLRCIGESQENVTILIDVLIINDLAVSKQEVIGHWINQDPKQDWKVAYDSRPNSAVSALNISSFLKKGLNFKDLGDKIDKIIEKDLDPKIDF